jgi:hypothetical protein
MQWDDIPPVLNYLYVSAPGHPLAAKNGSLPLHRWLAYRRLGPGPHMCTWCGVLVDWHPQLDETAPLVVDHVDRNRGNNEDGNLVPSCQPCNLQRGPIRTPLHRLPGHPARRHPGRALDGNEADRFHAQVAVGNHCWLWIGPLKAAGSYGRFLTDHGYVRAHRFAWRQAAGAEPVAGLHVLHTCDGVTCVRNDDPGIYVVDGVAYPRFGHLWLGTHRANMQDRAEKGRYASSRGAGERQVRGEQNGSAKLTEADVREIRRLLAEGGTLRGIAATFGVSKGPITQISRGKTWKHIG